MLSLTDFLSILLKAYNIKSCYFIISYIKISCSTSRDDHLYIYSTVESIAYIIHSALGLKSTDKTITEVEKRVIYEERLRDSSFHSLMKQQIQPYNNHVEAHLNKTDFSQ